jgi:carboxymethylenebutenolidase
VLLTGSKPYKLAGVIPFYAGLARTVPGADGTALEEAHKVHFPVLGLFGGADQGIPVPQVQQLDAELDRANVAHEIVIYEGAPHSFFDRKQTEFAEQSADAWTRVLNFIKNNTA